ncbi:outer membrane beta-barrel protein [Helicobacter bilis]|uniref:outer membrane beta-barrel protein n=1 Tax=Helicobacter bilis TaxID=37372 RepID=UPI0009873445|nr:outer membrane beta-barrel protein [Helicobacter bilis]
MRKTLSIMAASTLLAIGLGNTALADEGGEKSGLFVGVHGGVSLFGVGIYDETGKKATDRELKDNFGVNASTTSFNVGLKAGYQYFFMPIVGVRGYLGYDFNGSRALMKLGMGMKDVNVSFQNITLNADVMVNFLNTDSFTLGAYVGFGLGYGITGLTGEKTIVDTLNKGQDYNGFNIPINVGIAATFAGSHKVEIGAKIQALSAGYSSKTKNDKSEILMNTHVINVGYSYIF